MLGILIVSLQTVATSILQASDGFEGSCLGVLGLHKLSDSIVRAAFVLQAPWGSLFR